MLRAAVTLKEICGGGGKLFVGHLNHALRPEAENDAGWLQQLCDSLGVPLEIGKVDVAVMAAQQGDGLEAAARSARYEFLRQTSERLGARFVAVAHTADDQVETVLHRILRGTGLTGLAGIPSVRPLSPGVSLVRPLLATRRSDVLDYLAKIGQGFRTDASNTDPRWTRNRLRHELLPQLRKEYNADVDAALLRLATQAAESQNYISEIAAKLALECHNLQFPQFASTREQPVASSAHIDCHLLHGQSPIIVREVCKIVWSDARWPQQAMGFDQWQQLAQMIRGETPASVINLPGNIRASREKDVVILQAIGLP
jgi:tRNA(Ile)-lysidine synthase